MGSRFNDEKEKGGCTCAATTKGDRVYKNPIILLCTNGSMPSFLTSWRVKKKNKWK